VLLLPDGTVLLLHPMRAAVVFLFIVSPLYAVTLNDGPITPSVKQASAVASLMPQVLAAFASGKTIDAVEVVSKVVMLEEEIRADMYSNVHAIDAELANLQQQVDEIQHRLVAVNGAILDKTNAVENTMDAAGALCRLAEEARQSRLEGYANLTSKIQDVLGFTDSLKVVNDVTTAVKKFLHSIETENRILRDDDSRPIPQQCNVINVSDFVSELDELRQRQSQILAELALKRNRVDALDTERVQSWDSHQHELCTLAEIRGKLSLSVLSEEALSSSDSLNL